MYSVRSYNETKCPLWALKSTARSIQLKNEDGVFAVEGGPAALGEQAERVISVVSIMQQGGGGPRGRASHRDG